MKKLRHGMIGMGGISGKHLKGYLTTDNVETVAICDINETTLRKGSETWGIADTTTDYKTLLRRNDIDMVSVCLPNYLHAPITIDALNAGKHVHCEKPMSMNAAEAAAMVKASEDNKKFLMIGLNNRFTPHAQYAKSLVKSGWLGEIYFAKCGWLRRAGLPVSKWFREKESAGGGALIDLGVHFIDMAMYIMDYPEVETVTAKTYTKFGGKENSLLYTLQNPLIEKSEKFDVDDLAAGMINMKNDTTLMFEISWASNIEKQYYFYELYGTKGGINFRVDVTEGINDSKLKLFGLMNGQLVDLIPRINPNIYPVTEFSHFAECVLSGKPSEMAPMQQGFAMMQIIDAIYKSAETKRQVVF